MNPLNKFKITILPILIACVLGSIALSPQARAVCQQGCDTSNANTFLGDDALSSNTTGSGNTAVGVVALFSNTTGGANTATGAGVLFSNTTGINNTANGYGALYSNTTGTENTGTGVDALYSNTNGAGNTGSGFYALFSNTSGGDNTANGFGALYGNTTGSYNTANGTDALYSNTDGIENAADGSYALYSNTSGHFNTADGANSLFHNTTGSFNIALGNGAGSNLTTGDNNIDIGNEGVAAEGNTIRIGTQGTQTATFIAGVSGAGVMGQAVKVNASGQLGTAPSSVRFKQNIKSMGDSSDALFALRPVTFCYKEHIDPEGVPQFGLVAEEVEKVSPDLIVRDRNGKPYTVRYDAVNAMLLNEFLKEHRKVKKLEAALEILNNRLREQDAKIQQVSDQLRLSKPAPRIVKND